MGDEDEGLASTRRGLFGFSDDDGALLEAAWRQLAPRADALIARCADAVLAIGTASLPLAGLGGREHLIAGLRPRVTELFTGPHDQRWQERRAADGRALAKARLEPDALVAAAARLRELVAHDTAGALEPDLAGRTVAALGRASDLQLAIVLSALTAAREQEHLAALRDVIVSHLPSGVVLLDADGRVTTSARPSPRVFADTSPNGRAWREVLQPALIDAADLLARVERSRRLRREIILPRLDVALPTGIASFRITLTPLEHPMAVLLLHIEDLTDTLASEARATRADQLAKLSSMAATVAHEIRNPLAGVSAAVQVVASTLSPDDTRRGALVKVQEQVQRLGNLVGDLLSLSKPIALTPRAVDLATVARSVATGEHGTAEVKGHGSALADAALLTQVLFTLIQNAWQAGAHAVRIDIEGTTLRVLDDGPGIADEVRERVFEPFFTTKTRGTGLGLPTARKIVEAMGGALSLCPSPLGGAGFEVRLASSEERAGEDE